MAKRPRASAQPPVATADPSSPSEKSSPHALVMRAGDAVENLRDVLLAYVGLEKLLVPYGADDAEEIQSTRSELGALVTLVNEELHRRIEAVDVAVQFARKGLRHGWEERTS